ncbi:uncharacterized protein LOC128033909 [Gossypium raimondii]|uniref:uncharacterized protein LOC128033909 n=1 Tax=Gossypium raimondii TaxID=29730 RepID=UPI00227B7C40|nr:uncharacterized protein LOC128033909 [Gossypium raimondii]
MGFTQGYKILAEYEAEFLRFSKYAHGLVETDYDKKNAKIVEEIKRDEHEKSDKEKSQNKNKRDSSPSSFLQRLMKQAKFERPQQLEPTARVEQVAVYEYCNRRDPSECWRRIGAYYICEPTKHKISECPRIVESVRALVLDQRAPNRGTVQTEARQSGLVYAARCREDRDVTKVIVDTFVMHSLPNFALIDCGSTHSYISSSVSDWLVEHHVGLDCESKKVTFKVGDGEKVVMVDESRGYFSNVISALIAEKLVRKGCDAYLAYVHDISIVESAVKGIRIVKDFSDVFPKELPRLPPDRDVEFRINVLPRTTLVSIAPYRIAPKELKESKLQLQELLSKGFIWPSMSPWGAPVLFVKKKDDSMRMCVDYC